MHMRTLCSALLVLVWLEASAASTETCTAELKGEIRFESYMKKWENVTVESARCA